MTSYFLTFMQILKDHRLLLNINLILQLTILRLAVGDLGSNKITLIAVLRLMEWAVKLERKSSREAFCLEGKAAKGI